MPIRRVKKRLIPPAPKIVAKSSKKEPKKNPLYEKRPKNFAIGGDIQPKRDLTRFVRWPRYIRLQRQKRVLLLRLKVMFYCIYGLYSDMCEIRLHWVTSLNNDICGQTLPDK